MPPDDDAGACEGLGDLDDGRSFVVVLEREGVAVGGLEVSPADHPEAAGEADLRVVGLFEAREEGRAAGGREDHQVLAARTMNARRIAKELGGVVVDGLRDAELKT